MKAVVVTPTFNERENIEPFLRSIRAASDIDVLVVDDASPDGTGEIARELADELGGVSVLSRTAKTGLGSAYRDGFQIAFDGGYDVIVTMDADLSHDPAVIPTMLGLVAAGADCVIGSRYVPGGGTVNWPLHRRLLSRWGNAYTRRVLRLDAHDCTSGYRAYRAAALAAIDPSSTAADGYAFLTELVRRLSRRGAGFAETPITFIDRTAGRSKMSGGIVAESMLLVTRWGIAERLTTRGPTWSAAAPTFDQADLQGAEQARPLETAGRQRH